MIHSQNVTSRKISSTSSNNYRMVQYIHSTRMSNIRISNKQKDFCQQHIDYRFNLIYDTIQY